jgi:hypothetical protein
MAMDWLVLNLWSSAEPDFGNVDEEGGCYGLLEWPRVVDFGF